MKIAIIGSGSVGLYYGAKLAAVGEDVHFLLRSGREEAAREGIRVISEQNNPVHLRHIQHYGDTAGIGPCDIVIIALKTTQNSAIETHVPPLLHDSTALLTLQNGLGNEEFLAARFGEERILGGLCFVCLTRETPATVHHFGYGVISIGELRHPPRPRTEAIVAAFKKSGIDARLVPDLILERWRKLVWNVPFNGLAVAAGGLTVDRILADPALECRCRALMEEIIAVARALGHFIPTEFADHQIERTRTMGPYQPSTLVDFLAGRELEIESIWGEPLRQARAAGIPTPSLEELHRQLLQIDQPKKPQMTQIN